MKAITLPKSHQNLARSRDYKVNSMPKRSSLMTKSRCKYETATDLATVNPFQLHSQSRDMKHKHSLKAATKHQARPNRCWESLSIWITIIGWPILKKKKNTTLLVRWRNHIKVKAVMHPFLRLRMEHWGQGVSINVWIRVWWSRRLVGQPKIRPKSIQRAAKKWILAIQSRYRSLSPMEMTIGAICRSSTRKQRKWMWLKRSPLRSPMNSG